MNRCACTMKKTATAALIVATLGLCPSCQHNGTPEAEARPSTAMVTLGDVARTVTAPGQLACQNEMALAFGVSGKVQQVSVLPGDRVEKDQTLAALDAALLHARAQVAEAELEIAETVLATIGNSSSDSAIIAAKLALAEAQGHADQLIGGPTELQMAAAEADVAEAEARLAQLLALPDADAVAQAGALVQKAEAQRVRARAEYDSVKHRPNIAMLPQSAALMEATIDYELALTSLAASERPATAESIGAAKANLSIAKAKLAELVEDPSSHQLLVATLREAKAQSDLDDLLSESTELELQQARATVQQATLKHLQAQTDLEGATLKAPMAGTVTSVSVRTGDIAAAGETVIHVADCATLQAEVTVVEEDIIEVEAGQDVELYFDAKPDVRIWGTVEMVGPLRLPGDRPLYSVVVVMEETPHGLMDGMTVDASIVVEQRADAARLPRSVVRARPGGQTTVWVWAGEAQEERQVTAGLRGDMYVEILSGLTIGEEVVVQ